MHRVLFPTHIWKVNTRFVYLTFDDGPDPVATPVVLDCLNAEAVKGTFFLSGTNVVKHPEIVREISTRGHAIGLHLFTHSRRPSFSRRRSFEEIINTTEAIAATGVTPARMIRPPYGFFTWNTVFAARELDYRIVMWTSLSGDFHQSWSENRIVSNSLSRLGQGAILVFHDNPLTRSRIGKVLREVILRIKERGFAFDSLRV
ncbi:MAG TPA: polysaccharide deacetylase family protein [Bacteroidota bacterium]|nr:polysaccharide deacetylase family protein [Bacteroidota bacterium]